MHLLQRSQDLVVSRLGLEARVEQQGVTLRPPGVIVTNTPNSDTDAVGLVQASLDNIGPVGARSVLDVDLGERALGCSTAKSCHSGGSVGTLTGGQVALRADTIDGNAGSDPLLHVPDHALGLGVRCLVKAG